MIIASPYTEIETPDGIETGTEAMLELSGIENVTVVARNEPRSGIGFVEIKRADMDAISDIAAGRGWPVWRDHGVRFGGDV